MDTQWVVLQLSQQRLIQEVACGALRDGHAAAWKKLPSGMKDCAADVHCNCIGTELVFGMVDSLCDGEQIMEARCEASIVWMAHQAYR